jgi:hypothetical protein
MNNTNSATMMTTTTTILCITATIYFGSVLLTGFIGNGKTLQAIGATSSNPSSVGGTFNEGNPQKVTYPLQSQSMLHDGKKGELNQVYSPPLPSSGEHKQIPALGTQTP